MPRIGHIIALAGLMSALFPVSALADMRACAISRIEGENGRLRHDGVWRPLTVAALPGDRPVRIETGPETRAEIVCDDGIVLTVGVETTVDLDRLIGQAGPSNNVMLRLLRGIVGAVAPQRNWGRFDIAAPLAIASVRSTEWLVGHDLSLGTSAFVRTGAVVVRPVASHPLVTLAVRQGIDITNDSVGPAKVWNAARRASVNARLGLGWR